MAVAGWCLAGLLGPSWGAAGAGASAVCLECHDDLPDMSRSAHAVGTDKRTPDCIACHGPSLTHANKPPGGKQGKPDRIFTGKSALPADERSAVCLSCHAKDSKRSLWAGSQHPSADVACNTCHKVHTNHDKVMARATEKDV